MCTQSADFYWETVVFKVEDTLFRVPRHGLEDASDVFADMFRLPTGVDDQTVVEGQSNDNPIVLEGYTSSEFRSLLKILYPSIAWYNSATKVESMLGKPTLSPTITLSKQEWIDVLKLSTAWEMDMIRETAITQLSIGDKLTPLDKVVLARKYRISTWLEQGLCSLVTPQSGSGASIETLGVALGWESAAKVVWIQKQLECAAQIAREEGIEFKLKSIRCPECSARITQHKDDCMNCSEKVYDDEVLYAIGRPLREPGEGGGFIVLLSSILCSCRNGGRCPETGGTKVESKTCISCKAVVLRSDQVLIMGIIRRAKRDPAAQAPVDAGCYVSRFFGDEVKSLQGSSRDDIA
ncbi:hypothetical protein D9611_010130 [Ephemerocybe angulata]|uniref:BTB domain-containing protein n=1 Tax=Ephemerocybe angulata TaxID=980116 RepID=A0A8H5AZ73_9AGAR|nr:hypothetical protein D9611_010130 [Tulosesus angulatus]